MAFKIFDEKDSFGNIEQPHFVMRGDFTACSESVFEDGDMITTLSFDISEIDETNLKKALGLSEDYFPTGKTILKFWLNFSIWQKVKAFIRKCLKLEIW